MRTHEEIDDLFARIERFLNQQRDLYGDPIPRVDEEPRSLSPEREPSGEAVANESAMKKPPQITTQENLFGEAEPAGRQSGASQGAYPDEPWTDAPSLDELDSMINTCMKCSLGSTRTHFVFGVGNPHAGLALVGEAPGADEDAQGEPFVGRAGMLLNKILEAIGFRREEVYILNILKCRPPNNREPLPEEVELCEPYLWKQLELIRPKVIVCLGRVAAQVLLKTRDSLAAMRERLYDFHGSKVVVTYHPAALLRNPHWKRPAWEDVQKARKLYDELVSAQGES